MSNGTMDTVLRQAQGEKLGLGMMQKQGTRQVQGITGQVIAIALGSLTAFVGGFTTFRRFAGSRKPKNEIF